MTSETVAIRQVDLRKCREDFSKARASLKWLMGDTVSVTHSPQRLTTACQKASDLLLEIDGLVARLHEITT
jgi:hypothetical protein